MNEDQKYKRVLPKTFEERFPEEKKRYPTVFLSYEDLPEGKDWDVDNEYYASLKMVMAEKGKQGATYEIRGVAVDSEESEDEE